MLHDLNETIETVKIAVPATDDNPHGYVVINKADLTPEHRLHGEPAPVASESQAPRRNKKG